MVADVLLVLYAQESLAVKCVPQSEFTLDGSPNLEKIWFINRQAVV